jgi:hypothetical protein
MSAIEKFAREMLTPYKRPAQIIVTGAADGPTKVLKSR